MIRARTVGDAGGDNGVIADAFFKGQAIRQTITCWFCQADCAVRVHTLSFELRKPLSNRFYTS